MSCSLRYNITDSLERKELAKKHGKELILTAPALEVESEGLRMGIELAKEYGTQGSPIGVFGDRVMFNEELLEEIESIQLARDPEHVRNEVADLETELLASTRNIMRSLGLSENIVSELRDREGNPIEGVAMADILQRSISYLEGNQDELPEEVIHFYVQAMKDLSEPLYLTMRERVGSEPEYLEVQEEYAGLPYDEEDIIDEAIAKVILNRVRGTIKSGVSELFKSTPELSKIGTPEQYSQYLDTIFPDSKVKDILYHGSKYRAKAYNGGSLIWFMYDENTKENLFVFKKGDHSEDIAMSFDEFEKLPAHRFSKFAKREHSSATLDTFLGTGHYFTSSLKRVTEDYVRSGGLYRVIVNAKNLYTENNGRANSRSGKGSKELIDKGYDGVTELIGDSREYNIFEPEQIHILGSEQDIKGFKEFVKIPAAKQGDRNSRWWNRLISRLKEIFTSSDPFKTAARELFTKDLTRYAEAISVSQRETLFRSLGTSEKERDSIREALVKGHGSLEIVPVGRDLLAGKIKALQLDALDNGSGILMRYEKDGKPVKFRASDQSSVSFLRSLGNNLTEYRRMSARPSSVAAREIGVQLHTIGQYLMEHYAKSKEYSTKFNVVDLGHPPVPSLAEIEKQSGLTKPQFLNFEREVKAILDSMWKLQESIDPASKVDLYVELKIHNAKQDTGGTMDMMFMTSDASAHIYDYKFVMPGLTTGEKLVLEPLKGQKLEGYDSQMTFYKDTLRTDYAISKFGRTRLVPAHVEIGFNSKTKLPEGIRHFDMGFDSDPLLMQVPVAQEVSTSEKLNETLKPVLVRLEELKKKRLSKGERWEREKLRTAYREILNDSDMQQSISDIDMMLERAKQRLDITDQNDPLYLDNEDLLHMYLTLKTFNTLSDAMNIKASEYEDVEREEAVRKIKKLSEAVGKTFIAVQDLYVSRVSTGKRYDLKAISAPTRGLDKMNAFRFADNQFLQYTSELLSEAENQKVANTDRLIEKWTILDAGLEAWAKRNGSSLVQAYGHLNRETEYGLKLVTVFSDAFREERDAMFDLGSSSDEKESARAIKWMKENYALKEDYDEIYKRNRANFIKRLKKDYPNTEDARYKAAVQRFEDANNMRSNPTAWVNKGNYGKYIGVKADRAESFYSESYKFLLKEENRELLEYYHAWKNQMKEFSDLVRDELPHFPAVGFIPSIHVETIEAFQRGQGGLKALGTNFLNAFSVNEVEEERIGKSADRSLSLRYLNVPIGRTGKADTALVSRDLSRAMILFGSEVYALKAKTEIEDEIKVLTDLFSRSEEGTMKKGVLHKTNVRDRNKVSALTQELFQAQIDMRFYGIRSSESGGEGVVIAGREFSKESVIPGLMTAVSRMVMTMPLKAGFAAGLAGLTFTATSSTDNPNYSTEDLGKSQLMYLNNHSKYMALAERFNIYQEGNLAIAGREFKSSSLSRYMSWDYAYFPMVNIDRSTDRRLFVAMLHRHAADEKGELRRLDEMPEGTKSLAETLEEKNGQITTEIPDSIVNALRMRFFAESLGNRGNNTNHDAAAYQANIWFTAAMQFKTWMPPMLHERFGKARYDRAMGRYVEGRYWASVKSAIARKQDAENLEIEMSMGLMLQSTVQSMKNLILSLIRLNNYTLSERERERLNKAGKWSDPMEKRFQDRRGRLQSELNVIHNNASDPNMSKEHLSFERFVEMRQTSVRQSLAEMRAILGYMLLSMVAAMALDDDDEKEDYFQRQGMDLISRVMMEVAMFLNPSEFVKLTKGGIPMLGLLDLTIRWAGATTKVSWELLSTGESEDLGKMTLRFVPGYNTYRWLDGELRSR